MKILRYRTIAEVYPHLSLEAEVELDNGTIVYSNVSVNGEGKTEIFDVNTSDRWTYQMPLDKVKWDAPENDTLYSNLTQEEDIRIFGSLITLWNSNPVFDNKPSWKIFCKEKHMIMDQIPLLFKENLTMEDIEKILSNTLITEALDKGTYFDTYHSVAEFGEDNLDNDLYEGEGFEEWGEFLLSVPGACNIKLPSGRVLSLIE